MQGKIEIHEKSRQNAENEQTFDFAGKIEIQGKSRQNDENKQTFDFDVKKNIVKTMKIKKLLILTGKIEIEVIILWLDIYGLDLNGQKYSNLIYNSMQCSECMLFWGTRSMHLNTKVSSKKTKL